MNNDGGRLRKQEKKEREKLEADTQLSACKYGRTKMTGRRVRAAMNKDVQICVRFKEFVVHSTFVWTAIGC